jgi:AraC-like DNA-binding protein
MFYIRWSGGCHPEPPEALEREARNAAGRRRISRCATPAETEWDSKQLGKLEILRRPPPFRCFAAPGSGSLRMTKRHCHPEPPEQRRTAKDLKMPERELHPGFQTSSGASPLENRFQFTLACWRSFGVLRRSAFGSDAGACPKGQPQVTKRHCHPEPPELRRRQPEQRRTAKDLKMPERKLHPGFQTSSDASPLENRFQFTLARWRSFAVLRHSALRATWLRRLRMTKARPRVTTPTERSAARPHRWSNPRCR